MIRSRSALFLGTPLLLTSIVLGGASCSNKQLSSSSSDQSMTSTDQPAPGPIQQERIQPEPIQPDRMASIEPPAAASAEFPAYREEPRTQESRINSPSPSPMPASSVPPVAAATSSEPEPVNSQDITKLEDIYFDFDQYNIRSDAQMALERNGQWILKEKNKTVLIEGHCDERGTLAYNLVLGEKRAKSAKQYLERLGIPASRLHTTSYGEVRPSCKEHSEECWKYNRRAHFIVE